MHAWPPQATSPKGLPLLHWNVPGWHLPCNSRCVRRLGEERRGEGTEDSQRHSWPGCVVNDERGSGAQQQASHVGGYATGAWFLCLARAPGQGNTALLLVSASAGGRWISTWQSPV
ncbi:hypothetical protein GW17_00062203, partial [Ensete ventricosum]